MKKIVSIGSDHGGYELKEKIKKHFKSKYKFIDVGTNSTDSCDYPVFAIKACELVRDKQAEFAIVICKSGIGVSIAANKVKTIRCAYLDNVEVATLCHQHNNANAIALGANYVTPRKAYQIIKAYDEAIFEQRHQKRIDIINEYESR